MKLTKFIIEECPSHKTICRTCRAPIAKEEMRVTIKKIMGPTDYFHFLCYTPKLKQYIREKDLSIKLTEPNKAFFTNWLENWNSNYFNLEKVPAQTQVLKSLSSVASKYRRAFLEVFKFLDIREVLSVMALVNKEFYHTTWEPELWRCFMLRDFEVEINSTDWKASYVNEFHNRCIECRKIPEGNEIFRCPHLKRIICRKCQLLEKFELWNKGSVLQNTGVSPDKLGLKFIQGYNNQIKVYRFELFEALKKFRMENKKTVLKKMMEALGESHEFIKIVKTINTDMMESRLEFRRFEAHYDTNFSSNEFYVRIFDWIRTGQSEATLVKIIKKIGATKNV